MALPAINRLAKKNLISLTLQKGASYKTPFFRMVFTPYRGENTKVLIMTSKKKLDKRAVYRNKIRRKFLAILYPFIQKMEEEKNSSPFLIVIFPYPSSFDISFTDLQIQLEKGMNYLRRRK